MRKFKSIGSGVVAALALLAGGIAVSAPDKNTVAVTGGLGFAEFKGYESWQAINISHSGALVAVIVGNPTMIEAYQSGIPGNGKPFPDGARMAKIHWDARKVDTSPGQPTVGGALHDVDFMVKDSKRFADGSGWGYAMFKYDAATEAFVPGTPADHPPQGNDAKCGVACHTVAQKTDFVFTSYGQR